MFLDLDRFKDINDTLGHTMGDRLLRGVTGRLKALMREGDTIARMGGDEFMILLTGITHTEDVVKIATRILETLQPPFQIDDNELHITTSIGIALYPNDSIDVQTLLQNADAAMYRAKTQGRDNYQFYTPSLNARVFG